MEPVPDKVRAIHQWPTPRSFITLHGFLGLVGFYCHFIKGYDTLAAPLTNALTQPHLVWFPEAETAFQKLKCVVSTTLVLQLLNFLIPFTMETNASGVGMGAVLSQSGHPLAFFSKQFCPKPHLASAYVRELAAITTAIKKWRQYLLGHAFVILTDHCSLKELMSQTI